jgi:hypothetical protein
MKLPSVIGESFAPTLRLEKLEIHKVFLRFPTLDLSKNLSPLTLVNFISDYSVFLILKNKQGRIPVCISVWIWAVPI